MRAVSSRRVSRRNKVFAVLAGGLVLGIGGAATLAVWTDTEWAFGGAGGVPGIGTSTFAVNQNTSSPFVEGTFVDRPSNPGGSLIFTPNALALTPGDVTYTPIALRTSAASVGGTIQLQNAVAAVLSPAPAVAPNGPGDPLWEALRLSVGYSTDASIVCNAAAFSNPLFTTIVTDNLGLDGATIAGPQTIAAAGGNTLHYCFQITLPAGSPSTLQGLTVAPAWEFRATSTP